MSAVPRARPLRVLVVHNAYRRPGGEDAVVRDETALLRAAGHHVTQYTRDNDELAELGAGRAALETLWSARSHREVRAAIADCRADVVHVHNTFARVSPAVYFAAARAGVPVVQTLHNFRLLCPQALLLRDGKVCEACVGRLPWRAVRYGCYRDSRAQSAVLAGTLVTHRALGTWTRRVTRYIALNDFCRERFIAGGLPPARIVVKPNFVPRPGVPAGGPRQGGLFVGRLSAEKGVAVLADALRRCPQVHIDVYGDGPARALLENLPNCRLHGWAEPDVIARAMASHAFLVLPSQWYENFPRTLVEAWAAGLAVLASRIGALETLVEPGVTGWLFDPADAAGLAALLARAQADPERVAVLGRRARAAYEARYSPEVNLRALVGIYQQSMRAVGGAHGGSAPPRRPGV